MPWLPEKLSPRRYTPIHKPHRSLADLLSDVSRLPDHRVIDLSEPRHPKFLLSFSNLTYAVKTSSSASRILLSSVSGLARDGEILSVMGASGSGKSTLIDALARRIAPSSLSGEITLNGHDISDQLLRSISAYVMQDDLMYPMLTVHETLTFAAEFRLPSTLPQYKKKARVEALIDQLGLRMAAHTIIGDEGHRGISGGERRRVSIGTDIIHDPIILFLDEPTSGLDSTSAYMVVNVLKRIAASGSVVIMSVHQPSSRIVGLIDRVLFLSRGRTVYNGSPDGLEGFFGEFGRPIPDNENRTEFALDLIRELESSERDNDIEELVQFSESWQCVKNAALDVQLSHNVSLKEAIEASAACGKLVSGATKFANSWWAELVVLMRRSITNERRMPELFGFKLGTMLFTGFILATIFWRLDDSPKGVKERLGFMAFMTSTIYFCCSEALPVFLQERYIFMRETAYNAYRRSSYVLSNTLVGLPPLIILALAFSLTTFFAVGLAGGFSGFFFFFLTILASFWSGSSFVTFLSGVVPNVMIGYTIVVSILAYFLLFGGFFINRDRIPNYWIWFHYLSLEKYPYEAVLRNEFGEAGKCFSRGVQLFDSTMMRDLPEEMKAKALGAVSRVLGGSITEESCVSTAADVLKDQGVEGLSKWDDLLVTVAWGGLFRVLFYFALLLGSKNKRR